MSQCGAQGSTGENYVYGNKREGGIAESHGIALESRVSPVHQETQKPGALLGRSPQFRDSVRTVLLPRGMKELRNEAEMFGDPRAVEASNARDQHPLDPGAETTRAGVSQSAPQVGWRT